MTPPADPREALEWALSIVEHRTMASITEAGPQTKIDAGRIIESLERYGYTLAARQDEPSPALPNPETLAEAMFYTLNPERGEWDDVERRAWRRHAHTVRAYLANLPLAANPPQTREAEGAAPDGD